MPLPAQATPGGGYRLGVFGMLRQRRFVVLTLIVLLVSVLCVFLGRWQWHRHVERRATALAAETALAKPPTPVDTVLKIDQIVDQSAEFRQVTLTGTYDAAHQILWRNPRGGGGYDVITPLVPDSGTALLIDRGWVPYSLTDELQPAADVTPPTGTVQVIARLRPDAPADDRQAPAGQTYRISSEQLGADLPYDLYRGYGELVGQTPPPDSALILPANEIPSLGPHQLYAYQWWIFSVLVWVGLVLLLRRESIDARDGSQLDSPDEEPSPTVQNS